jgi:hypothetical protein
MSTQETAKITVELTLSSDGEILGDTELTETLWSVMDVFCDRLIDNGAEATEALGVNILGRTGHLNDTGKFLTPEEADEISELLGYLETYIENHGYKNMSSDQYEKDLARINRLRNRLDQR